MTTWLFESQVFSASMAPDKDKSSSTWENDQRSWRGKRAKARNWLRECCKTSRRRSKQNTKKQQTRLQTPRIQDVREREVPLALLFCFFDCFVFWLVSVFCVLCSLWLMEAFQLERQESARFDNLHVSTPQGTPTVTKNNYWIDDQPPILVRNPTFDTGLADPRSTIKPTPGSGSENWWSTIQLLTRSLRIRFHTD